MSVRSLSATLALSATLLGAGASAAFASPAHTRPSTYELPGDPGGSKFEGIGFDARTNNYYVSETTGGEIHRGQLRPGAATEWLQGDGTDGRWTARGVNVDSQGRVYVAGGPNGIDHPGAPDLWVMTATGSCWPRCGPACRTRS